MASKLSLRDKLNLLRSSSAVAQTARRSNLADTFRKLQECGTFTLFKKAVDGEEVVEVEIDQVTECDTTVTAGCDDKAMDNNIMFDYMYGSSESEDGGDSIEGGSDSKDSGDSDEEQFAVAPDPSELVLCCSEIKSHSTDGGESKSKNSEIFLAHRALHCVDLGMLMQSRCNSSCKKECIERVGLTAIGKLRYVVWFERDGKKRSQTNRLAAIFELVKQAHACYNRAAHGADAEMQRFTYMVGDTAVCELSFQQLIGVIPAKSKCMWKGWTDMKYRALGLQPPVVPRPKPKRDRKTRSCKTFIQNSCDTLLGDSTSLARYGEYTYLPYRKIDHFFASYQLWCENHDINHKDRAKFKTFTNTFCAVKEEMKVKLQTDAGGFDTCEICRNAELLMNEKHKAGWTREQLHIVIEFLQHHHLQQQRERQHLENNMAKARELDENGQPLQALLFSDGFTEDKASTARYGMNSHGQRFKLTTKSRVIGVEVVCGPIHKFFTYYTDNLVSKGANIMIEVQRQALLDLDTQLKSLGMDLPRKLMLQFDNSTENKNRYMFTWLSLLVENNLFDVIEVNFLIVGHTHASIDQFFSVLAKAIERMKFICSPLGIEEVILKAFSEECGREVSVRRISVYYNYTEALQPMVNTSIKYFGVPHNFIFHRVCGRCTMQYKLFSTNQTWLPQPTKFVNAAENMKEFEIFSIDPQAFDSVGGVESFNTYTKYDTKAMMMSRITTANMRRVENREFVFNDLVSMESTAILEAEIRFDNPDGAVISPIINVETKIALENVMKRGNSQKTGYIMWVKMDRSNNLFNISPIWPSRTHTMDSFKGRPKEFHSLSRNAYLQVIKDYIESNTESAVSTIVWDDDDISNARTDEELFTRLRATGAQVNLATEILKEADAKKQKGGAASGILEMVDAAKSIFRSIFPDRIISLSDLDEIDTSRICISNNELIYYFEHLTEERILHSLYMDIENELAKGPFQLLPISRCTDLAEVALDRETRKRSVLDATASAVQGVLSTATARYSHQREVLAREGITLDPTAPDIVRDRKCTVATCECNSVAQCLQCGCIVCHDHITHASHEYEEMDDVFFTPASRGTAVAIGLAVEERPAKRLKTVNMSDVDKRNLSTILLNLIQEGLRDDRLWEETTLRYNSGKVDAIHQTEDSLKRVFTAMGRAKSKYKVIHSDICLKMSVVPSGSTSLSANS